MDKKNYIAAIDLGSSHVVAGVASKDADGKLNIIDMVIKPMHGMAAGEVTNIEQVTSAAREAISEIEANLDIKLTEAYTGISGQDINSADSSYFVYVSGEDFEIQEEDVVKLHESMNNLQAPEGVCILDRVPQKYIIDMQEETMQPVGRFGNQLQATFNFVLGSKSSVDRLGKAFKRLEVTQKKLFTNAQASAAAVLTEDERELGAAVVDIGAGCTDICIWQDNIMRYVGVIPIGSDAINRDIRSVAIPERFIEKLKIAHGYAVANNIPDEKKGQSIKIKGRTPRETKEISFYNLAQIIEARMLDIVENVMEVIKDSGYADKLGSGIVLTGGGSMLTDIETLFRERTKYDVRIAAADPALLNDESLAAAEDLRLTSAIGLLLLGLQDSNLSASATTVAKKPRHAEEPVKNTKETSNEEEDDNGEEYEGPGDTIGEETDIDTTPARTPKVKKEKVKKEKNKKPGNSGGGLIKSIKGIFTDIFEVVDDDEI